MSDFVAPNTEYMKGLTKVKEKMIEEEIKRVEHTNIGTSDDEQSLLKS